MSSSSRGKGRAIFLLFIMIVSVLGATVAFSGAAAAENASVSYDGPVVPDINAVQNTQIDIIRVNDSDSDGDVTEIDQIKIAGVEPNSDLNASELESVSLKIGDTTIATNSSVTDLDVLFGHGSGTEFVSGFAFLSVSDVDSDGENELVLADGASARIDVVATVTGDATNDATFEYATSIALTGAFGGDTSPEIFNGSVSDFATNSEVDVATVSVDNISTDHNFTGVVADEENLTITASGIAEDGVFVIGSGTVDIRVVSAEGNSIERSDVSVENGIATAEISTEEFDPETNTSAPADIVVEEAGDSGVNGSVELVHEAKNPGEGFTLMSVPQPAEIEYQDADAIQQYNATAQKSKNLYPPAPDRFDDSTDLHRGFWFEGGNDQARIGFEYDTTGRTTPGLVELNTGWHLASSNFDVSDSTSKKIEKDITPVLDESTGISIFAGDQGQLLTTGDTVGAYDAYWVFVDETAQGTTRSTLAPKYDPSDRDSTLSE